MPSKIPMTVSDSLLHIKNSDTTENVILPITRYDNVMNSPRVVTDGDNIGAPFVLLKTGEETISIETLRKLCGGIV